MITALSNAKGGVLKTTLSVHMADWFAIHDCKVVLLDCDGQKLGLRWAKDAGCTFDTLWITDPQEVYAKLPELDEQYDVVVVDCPGGLSDTTGAVLHRADHVLIPTGPTYLDLRGSDWTVQTVKQIQEERGGLPETGLIVTGYTEGAQVAKNVEAFAKNLHFGFVKSGIPQRAEIAKSCGIRKADDSGWKVPPSLVWRMGKSKPIRTAALYVDAVLQAIYGAACVDDPERILKMVTTKAMYEQMQKENHGKAIAANG